MLSVATGLNREPAVDVRQADARQADARQTKEVKPKTGTGVTTADAALGESSPGSNRQEPQADEEDDSVPL
jgi:hypothetical protein